MSEEVRTRGPSPWWDRAGALVSTLCAVHCAGLGLVLILFPGLWLRRQQWPVDLAWLLYLEWALAAIALGLATVALGQGYVRHRRPWPILLAVPGLALMGAGIFTDLHWWPLWGSVIVLSGGLLLVAGHLSNLALLRRAASPRAAATSPACRA